MSKYINRISSIKSFTIIAFSLIFSLIFSLFIINDSEVQAKSDEQKKLEKMAWERKNEVNIDKIGKDQKGYTISMRPLQKDNKLVKPTSMKVYKKANGKLVDVTDKGEVSHYSDNYILWSYKHDDNKNVKSDLKKDLGNQVVFDVKYEKPIADNKTKEGQMVKKQIHELKNDIIEDKSQKDNAKLKKHNKLLKENQNKLKDISKDEKKTHRYMHELRYE
ncbi:MULTISPECIES: hypothetical protein [Staphylococcus]|uniref:hypothetical protein n=1 Tax=Staphylococcus TaxID=1279 RepID=UPI000852B27C|nr:MULTISPECIES: hypothetical protein [Staphylococcus]OEL06515.1 hypothetical protein AST04_13460 [Staphylococcus equorum]PTE76812.1 hypothetical protein BUY85_11165 [Staphylococcus equorum]PTH26175.1 hypothetical protein BU605_07410 [Staphylococcus arlettae]RIM79751.1 hypothetical protein BU593_06310 [Staphylococcus arlettae]